MCGIGAYGSTAQSLDRDELMRMRDHLSARGPDGKGEWISADRKLGLGHRRLSIIDLSEIGAQPMRSVDGNLVVTFNGEIYNYRALRRDLAAQGCIFRSHSDTEVLLHLYALKRPRDGRTVARHVRFCHLGSRASAAFVSRAIPSASSRSTMPMTGARSALPRR